MQRTANENAACIRRICKRSDQPKVERITNNDARMILLLIRSFTAFSFAVLCIIFFHYIRDFPRDHCARNMSEEKSTTCQGILPLRVLLRSPQGVLFFILPLHLQSALLSSLAFSAVTEIVHQLLR